MKTIKFKTDSWHYKFVSQWDPIVVHRTGGTDICSYVRALMLGLTVMALLFGILGLFAGVLLYAIGNWIGYFLFGYALSEGTPFVTIIYACFGAFIWYNQWKENRVVNEKEKEPGFIRLAYRSWKDKFCAKVEFE